MGRYRRQQRERHSPNAANSSRSLASIGDPAVRERPARACIRRRERNGAIDLPKRRPRAGDRVQIISGLFTGRFGLCARVSREHIGVLLFMLGAQRPVRLNHDAVELATEEFAS